MDKTTILLDELPPHPRKSAKSCDRHSCPTTATTLTTSTSTLINISKLDTTSTENNEENSTLASLRRRDLRTTASFKKRPTNNKKKAHLKELVSAGAGALLAGDADTADCADTAKNNSAYPKLPTNIEQERSPTDHYGNNTQLRTSQTPSTSKSNTKTAKEMGWVWKEDMAESSDGRMFDKRQNWSPEKNSCRLQVPLIMEVIRCGFCNMAGWQRLPELLKHIETYHSKDFEMSFQCQDCHYTNDGYEPTWNHFLNTHRPKELIKFPPPKKLRGHFRPVIVCTVCDFIANNKQHYIQHAKREHFGKSRPLPRYQCKFLECKALFKDDEEALLHRDAHIPPIDPQLVAPNSDGDDNPLYKMERSKEEEEDDYEEEEEEEVAKEEGKEEDTRPPSGTISECRVKDPPADVKQDSLDQTSVWSINSRLNAPIEDMDTSQPSLSFINRKRKNQNSRTSGIINKLDLSSSADWNNNNNNKDNTQYPQPPINKNEQEEELVDLPNSGTPIVERITLPSENIPVISLLNEEVPEKKTKDDQQTKVDFQEEIDRILNECKEASDPDPFPTERQAEQDNMEVDPTQDDQIPGHDQEEIFRHLRKMESKRLANFKEKHSKSLVENQWSWVGFENAFMDFWNEFMDLTKDIKQKRWENKEKRRQRERELERKRNPNTTLNNGNTTHRSFQPDKETIKKASSIQRLYNNYKRSAIRKILEGPSDACEIDLDKLYSFHADNAMARTPEKTFNSKDRPLDFPVLPKATWTDKDKDTTNLIDYRKIPLVLDDFVNGPKALKNRLSPDEYIDAIPGHPLLSPLSSFEIRMKLKRCSDSAPGLDRLKYSDWKMLDKGGHFLAALFRLFQRFGKLPRKLKESRTILIQKDKNELDKPQSWRPIALLNTLYKLFTGVVAHRLNNWGRNNDILSDEQKGFSSTQGCAEHNFSLQCVIEDARRSYGETAIGFLDIQQAFPSIQHEAIFQTLEEVGAPAPFIDLVRDIYDDSFTTISTIKGRTLPIPVKNGIRQGDGLSPILFNLVFENLLRPLSARTEEDGYTIKKAYDNHGAPLRLAALAYADDLVLIGRDAKALQNLLNTAERGANWLGFSFKNAKSATFHLHCKQGRRVRSTIFNINGCRIPTMSRDDGYSYLGTPMGYSKEIMKEPETLRIIGQEVKKIKESLLAPWQMLDAIKLFVLTKLQFAMRTHRMLKKELNILDSQIYEDLREILRVKNSSNRDFFNIPVHLGGVGFNKLTEELDVCRIGHVFQLLRSTCTLTRKLAKDTLIKVIKAKAGANFPTPNETIAKYLNGSMEGQLGAHGTDIQSIFSLVRKTCREFNAKTKLAWTWPNGEVSPKITVTIKRTWHGNTQEFHYDRDSHFVERIRPEDDSSPLPTPGNDRPDIEVQVDSDKQIFKSLRTAMTSTHITNLMTLRSQGMFFASPINNRMANHFILTGRGLRFKDYYLINKARLNLCPVRGNIARYKRINPRCRRCLQYRETLHHILNMCPTLHRFRTLRHNKVQQRVKALCESSTLGKGQTIRVNQTVIGSESALRPDIVITNKDLKKTVIIDIAITGKYSEEDLNRVRARKEEKYRDLANFISRRDGTTTKIFTWLVGGLGGWDVRNEKLFKYLDCKKSDAKFAARFSVTDAIQGSVDTYKIFVKNGPIPRGSNTIEE